MMRKFRLESTPIILNPINKNSLFNREKQNQ